MLKVATWSRHRAKVNSLLIFGDHILSVDVEGNLYIWAFKGVEQNLAPIGHIMLDDNITPSCIMHPDTYLNKVRYLFCESFFAAILHYHFRKLPFPFNLRTKTYEESCKQIIIGSQEGSLQLWNISTKKKLYEFKGWKSSICSCVSSPALDVVAVGCADGKVHVHNIRYDEEVVTFTHSTRGAVTALSFCTGNKKNNMGKMVVLLLC